jgi:hypothetical protein
MKSLSRSLLRVLTAASAHYHAPGDAAGTLDYGRMAGVVGGVANAALTQCATGDIVETWQTGRH